MSRRTLVNVALLLVVAGLAAFIALAPRDVVESPPPFTSLDPAAVSRVIVEQRDGDLVELVREEESWRLVRPMDLPGNAFRIHALLRLLRAPVHADFEATGADLARYGLAPPRTRVQLGEAVFLLGDTEPLHGRRYVAHGDRIVLVDDVYIQHVGAGATSFVSPSPLGPEPGITEIRLPGLRVHRVDDRWRIEPARADVGADSVVGLVDAWRGAQATAVQPYDPALAWQDRVSITLGDRTLDFDLARTEHAILLGRRELGIQYRLTRRGGERLLDLAPADHG